nr:hypothetical protein [Nocardia crassostreae]
MVELVSVPVARKVVAWSVSSVSLRRPLSLSCAMIMLASRSGSSAVIGRRRRSAMMSSIVARNRVMAC